MGMMLTYRISASEAYNLGLANEVVPLENLMKQQKNGLA